MCEFRILLAPKQEAKDGSSESCQTQQHTAALRLTFQNYLIVNLIISPVTNYSGRIEIISVSMKCGRE